MRTQEATKPMAWGERLSDLRERTATFLSDMGDMILSGPAEAVADWAEDKPDWVKAVGGFAITPLLIFGEVVGGAVAAITLAATTGPALAVAAGVGAFYLALETALAGDLILDQLT